MSAGGLAVLPLRFVLRSRGLSFPAFPGTFWRSGLGMTLARCDGTAFRTLFQHDGEAAPYALAPGHGETVPAGQTFHLDLTLLGPACRHAPAVAEAVGLLGETGIRPGGRFSLAAIRLRLPGGEGDWTGEAVPQAQGIAEWLARQEPPARGVAIELCTPLRLKDGNLLVRHTPSYATLTGRLLGRVAWISRRFGASWRLPEEDWRRVREEAARVDVAEGRHAWQGLSRRSARSGQVMHFGGLTGWLGYFGAIEATLPLWRLGEVLQLGGKTAFGFGAVKVHPLYGGDDAPRHRP